VFTQTVPLPQSASVEHSWLHQLPSQKPDAHWLLVEHTAPSPRSVTEQFVQALHAVPVLLQVSVPLLPLEQVQDSLVLGVQISVGQPVQALQAVPALLHVSVPVPVVQLQEAVELGVQISGAGHCELCQSQVLPEHPERVDPVDVPVMQRSRLEHQPHTFCAVQVLQLP
jgi:hypothetical protein